ncbi:hypothetical protein GQ42DRAFT_160222 [Ramicandelaber brevisporus]|nr:hypothetical protein GQ42DRAFT_160222 [Ramicandelaber brevisporus]
MFLFKKSTTSSVLAAEKLSLVPIGAVNTKNPPPTDFIVGKLGITPTKVAGEVVLNYPNNAPIKLKRIEIVLRGQCSLCWTEETATSDGYVTEARYKRKVLLDRKLVLWESTVGEFVEMTSDRFPFSINLQSTLLSSMKADNADVAYSLEAIVTRSKRADDDVKRILIDLPLINHGALLAAIMVAPIYLNNTMEVVLPQHHAGQGITWRCTVTPAGCVYRGEQVSVNLTMTLPPHLKNAHVSIVYLALKERTVIYDDSGRERSARVNYITKTNNTKFSCKDLEYKVMGAIGRPRTGMSDTCKFSSYISISHSVELMMFMGGVKDIEVEAPLCFSSMTREEAQQVITARGETTTTTETPTTTAVVVAIDYSDAPPPYEIGDWTPNPPAADVEVESSALPPLPVYETL